MDEFRIKIEQLIEDLENETSNRNMNDLEEGRYKTLCEVLDLIDEQKNWRFQRKVQTLTNEQKIRDKISTIEGLADYLVSYNDNYGEFYTSDCESFETKGEAVQHEIEWLKEEYNELW